MACMFVLAHLSDPHLGPLPAPRLRELAGQAGDRLHQLAAQAPAHPSRRRARAHRRGSEGAGARPHRRDRRSRQHLASRRIPAGTGVACIARAAARRHPGARQSRRLRARGRAFTAAPLGRLHARRRCRHDSVSIPAPARSAGADRIIDRGSDRALHGNGTAWWRADSRGLPKLLDRCAARVCFASS